MFNLDELRKKAQIELEAVKAIKATLKDSEDVPKEIADKITAHLGKFDEYKAQMELAKHSAEAEHYMDEPAGTKAAHLGWRDAAPGEGEAPVDPAAYRQVEVETPFGKKAIRFHVPLAVQAEGYASAFEAYLRKSISDLGPRDRKTLTEGVDTAGGFLVPEDYQTELIKKIAAMTAIRPNARVVGTSRDMASWPRVKYTTDDKYTSGVRLTWTGESPASSTAHRVTDPVFGIIKVPVHTAMASMPISNDFIEDAVFDVVGLSSDLLAEAFGLGEDDVFVNGTGVSQPMGILTQVDGDGPASVVSGAAAALTADGLLDLFFAVPAQYRRTGKFVLNSGAQKAIEKLKDSQGRYIISALISGSLATPLFDSIKGKPILVDEFMPDVAAGAYPMLFGDLSGYLVLDRVGFSIQKLTELYAETNITLLLARKRVGGYCAEPYRMKIQKISA